MAEWNRRDREVVETLGKGTAEPPARDRTGQRSMAFTGH